MMLLASAVCQAQDSSRNPVSLYDRMERAGISIRKSFEGSKKDEEKPANFFAGRDFREDFTYTNIDLGLKLGDLELLQQASAALLLFPKLEWHKDGSNRDARKNTLSAGVNAEFFPVRAAIPGLPGGCKVAPVLLGSFDFEKDYVEGWKSLQPKVFLSLFSNAAGYPGSAIRHRNGAFLLRWYPYTGFEHFRLLDIFDRTASYWTSRLFFELYPIPTLRGDYLQFTFDYSYRVRLHDALYQRGNLSWLCVGANFYPDGKGKLGIGVEYTRGDDPDNRFQKTDKILFGLKVKI